MNTNNIKKYAPKARRDFIAAMTKQAARYGITAKGIEALEQKGDVALNAGLALFVTEWGATHADGGYDGIVCAEEALPAGYGRSDRLVIDDLPYTVRSVLPDGTGMVRLHLERA